MWKRILIFIVLLAVVGAIWYSLVATDIKDETVTAESSAQGDSAGGQTAGGDGSGFGTMGPGSFGAGQEAPGPTRRDDGLPEGNYEPNEVLVADPPENLAAAVKQMGFTVLERIELSTLDMQVLRLQVPQGLTVRSAVKTLREKFPGVNIDANHQFDPSADKQAAQPKAVDDTHLVSYVRAAAGWGKATQFCGRGLVLGSVDGMVQTRHPALRGQKVEFRSFHNQDRRPGPADHGTAIAAMLVGRAAGQGWGGIFPGATLKAANMFEYNAKGRLVGSATGLAKALDWMAASGVHVVNLSLAGEDNRILRTVFQKAQSKGLVMVASAGNWGRSDRPAFPAAYEDVIAVTAFGAGQQIYEMANSGTYIDFAAPGVKMWTAVPGGGRVQSGTSFATPYIAALAAEQVAAHGRKDAGSIIESLRRFAVDLGEPGKDFVYGWGFVARAPSCGN